ncbi:PAS domain S-box protein [Tumebacillus sp. ITR2]|uniref:histidine kinase n=1 Tax=Tumebacillus amylolyticus TaxID=2801339 RepID=A0ABS1JDD5_9BACL|nr:ATP-binding protein [Tumebacillus amylolyticus]MBL0388299.1 PAS domain S-box protein [Tumebacillus amylolyticus]
MVTDKETQPYALFDDHPAPTWRLDRSGKLLAGNQAAQQMFGERTHIEELVVAVDIDRMRALIEHAFLEKAPQNGRASLLSTSTGPVQAAVTIIPAQTGEGAQTSYVIAQSLSVAPRQQTEDELREVEELLDSVFRHSKDGIALFDLNGRILRLNSSFERMFGYTREEMQMWQYPVTPESERVVVRQMFQQVLQQTVPYAEHETTKVHKDGYLLDVHVTLSPIKNRDGHIVAISGIARDITVTKSTQKLLVQAEKLSVAGQLAAGVAHEIRNPLTALKGFVQLMEGGAGANPHYLRVMGSELNRIELITNELLVLAKPQHNLMQSREIAPLLGEVITLFETQAILRNVEVVTDFEPDLKSLTCDENQLKQVFINFLKNALEAMPNGGRIEIRLSSEGERVRISVTDQGNGIEPDVLARLGEPFFTTKENGTGLGFLICKQIIENHKGEIRVASVVGKGTTISVWLPYS